jgi:hypothetical protein
VAALYPTILTFLVMSCELSDVLLQVELLGRGVLRGVLLVHGDEPVGLLHEGVRVDEHIGGLAEVSCISC